MKKFIVVTGGAGFVGSNLIKLLIRKTKFKIISLDNTDFVVLISFLIFVGALVYFKVPSIVGAFLDKRSNDIQNEIEKAGEILEEAKKILKSRGFSELELLANWERIVGKKFAKLTIPLRLKIGKSSEKNNGKLIVKVDRSVAFAFEHEREKIIKKINLFFGYEVINKVEIIQASIKVKKPIKINKA